MTKQKRTWRIHEVFNAIAHADHYKFAKETLAWNTRSGVSTDGWAEVMAEELEALRKLQIPDEVIERITKF